MLYYENYEIPEKDYLNEEEIHVLYACSWMVENRATIRETALNCNYSYTTLWRRIHNDCKLLSNELYGCVLKQIKLNLERIGKK